MRHYFEFNGKTSRDFGLFLSAPGVYDAPSPDVEAVSVPGLNGDLIRENAKPGSRRFQNVDIKYDALFLNEVSVKTQAVKSWLLSPSGYARLSDTYDPLFYRMAVCALAPEFDVTRHRRAEVSITFNCMPQRWSVSGENEISVKNGGILRNPFEFKAEPLIRVSGRGDGNLYVGEYKVSMFSINGDVILNCKTQNAYADDGTFLNDMIYAQEFPVLGAGENEVSWDGGIESVKITPNWWTL